MAAPRPPENLTPTVSLDFGSGATTGIFTVPSSECGSPDPGCTEGYHVWQTDDAMARVFRGYEQAGMLLLFTEENALSVDDLRASICTALDPKGQHTSRTAWQILLCKLM